MAEGTTRALYVPFWTIDAQEATTYWAKKTVRSGKNTRVENISGEQVFTFDDLLMPASPLVTPLIRDGILHEFEPARLRPYTAGYIAGFAAVQASHRLGPGPTHNRESEESLVGTARESKDSKLSNHRLSHVPAVFPYEGRAALFAELQQYSDQVRFFTTLTSLKPAIKMPASQ